MTHCCRSTKRPVNDPDACPRSAWQIRTRCQARWSIATDAPAKPTNCRICRSFGDAHEKRPAAKRPRRRSIHSTATERAKRFFRLEWARLPLLAKSLAFPHRRLHPKSPYSEQHQGRKGIQVPVRKMERQLLRLPGEGKQTGAGIDDNNLSRFGDGVCSICAILSCWSKMLTIAKRSVSPDKRARSWLLRD